MKLNKKGYMLIEIILASAIAFGVGYFILQMVINLKNKNDDLLVETLTTTDQTIITNKLMQYAMKENDQFTCKLTSDGKTLYYEDSEGNNNIIDVVNDYAEITTNEDGTLDNCLVQNGIIDLLIPLSVPQMIDKDFNVNLNYKYKDQSYGSVNDGDQGCTIKFDCGEDEGTGHWIGAPGVTTFTVSYGTTFKLINHDCKNDDGSILYRKQYGWKWNGQDYYGNEEFTCTAENNIMIFPAAWRLCQCRGPANSDCGDGRYDSGGHYCLGNGVCCE